MAEKTEVRMAAAASYFARRWPGKPIPDNMTPKFAERVIQRWRRDVSRGIVAIPPDIDNMNHQRVIGSRRFDFGGSSIELGRDEVVIGKEVYSGPSTR